jgi:two-component system, cell cycle response regulator DivK
MARLLLVEDDALNRDMLSRRLMRKGFDVVTAETGEQALEMAKASPPALILMDMRLPHMDGWEATRRLKAAPETAGIPIIGLTAHAMASDRQRCLEAGCDDYQTKPVDLDCLVKAIDLLMRQV